MNINLNEFRTYWYEDANGDVIPASDEGGIPENAATYHSMWPLQLNEEICAVGYFPEKKIHKLLYKIPALRPCIEKKVGRTFRHILTSHTGYKCMEKVIIAMVNSGKYTLSEAIWICATCCERCMNVLVHEWCSDDNDGYAEFSDEWKQCNTICHFCESC